jgi:hypothetical protein
VVASEGRRRDLLRLDLLAAFALPLLHTHISSRGAMSTGVERVTNANGLTRGHA